MHFFVNGNPIDTDKDIKLLDFLRYELGLTGTKDGCSEGACGTCTVIMDGKAVKACVQKTGRLEGKNIITIEGLSNREKEVFSYCFAECGAVQCGFCIPGMIMCAKALIDSNPNPSREDVKKAIRGNICRCTGYIKIEDAILMAAWYFREDRPIALNKEEGRIGQRFRRIDAFEKALGRGIFANDIELEGMLYVSALRTPYPRARILKIDTSELEKDIRCSGIIRKKDVPNNRHGHITKDWPVLYGEGDITSYIGDAILLIASYDRYALDELKKLVKVEAVELEGTFSAEEALENKIIVHSWENTNLYREENIVRGDTAEAFRKADYILERTYVTPHTEHAFMEPECCVALPDMDGGVRLYTSGQSIYDEQRECAEVLNLPKEKVRVTSALVGGGFGGKEDMSVQHHAALAAYLLDRPVKVRLSRQESLDIHPKRHPMKMSLRLACDRTGRILGLEEDILADTGAYASLGGPVLQRACTHAGGPYNYRNLKVRGRAIYTNNVPSGAFRGFGVTQSCFAMESALDEMAKMIGIDPFEIRMRNAIRPGDVLPNGQIAGPDTAMVECLLAVKDAYYSNFARAGLACCMKNAGIGMGLPDTGRCIVSVEQGMVHIRTSAACMGQGFKTVALQIAVESTGLAPEMFIVEEPDTHRTPDSGTSTASRQTAFTGEAVKRASLLLGKELGDGKTIGMLEGKEFYAEFCPPTDPIDSRKEYPVSHLSYSYSAQVAILDEKKAVERIVACCDAGTVINRMAIEGQIEGGVVTGMGYAVRENFIQEKGYVKSKYGTLGLLRATEIPEIEVITVQAEGKSPAAYGAKGVGELCAIPTAPAIRNAYYKVDGKPRYSLPLEDTGYRK